MRPIFQFGFILANLLLHTCTYLVALGLRFDFESAEIFNAHRLIFPALLLLLFRTGTYIFYDLHRGPWRYASTYDALRLVKAHAGSSILFATAVGMLRVPEFPRSVIAIEFFLSVVASGGARFAARLVSERLHGRTRDAREIVILGAGDSGHLLVKMLQGHRKFLYRPVAVLDDSERMTGSFVQGVPVLGPLSMLEAVLNEHERVSAVVVAIPALSPEKAHSVTTVCKRMNVQIKRLQSFEDIACLDGNESREVLSIESVLERENHVQYEDEIRNAIRGKRVLVTGGGGSIGSELVRQLLPFDPESVCVLDNSEYNLFSIEQELRGSRTRFVLGSIRDEQRLDQVFSEISPEIVFHAAAFKHVPLLEANCYEAFRNNVIGTKNLLEVSDKHAVSRFVLISTDKAVDPSSIMGCTKRLSELLVTEFQAAHPLKTAVVRFGNVINSAGSVIPLFKKQILSGGPLTVTHPEMERYFMSIREAVRLVLTAGTLGEEGEIYVLDMGKPIRIVDVAQKMLALYGRRDIPIVFTGLRPGEKLTEELVGDDEERQRSPFARVSRIVRWGVLGFDLHLKIGELQRDLSFLSDRSIAERVRMIAALEPVDPLAGRKVAGVAS